MSRKFPSFLALLIMASCFYFAQAKEGAVSALEGCKLSLDRGAVVGFIGGADVVAAQTTGHTESLLAALFPGAVFRNFGWEGDTVHAQPRDYGFPPLKHHLKHHGVNIAFIQFGRMEALEGHSRMHEFTTAYQKMLDDIKPTVSKIVLVTPPPFEKSSGSTPDLTARNVDLEKYCAAIRSIAEKNSFSCIDLFSELNGKTNSAQTSADSKGSRFTDNGLQLNSRGHATVALAFIRQLGCDENKDWPTVTSSGAWDNLQLEELRQLVIQKNVLWTHYWRPHNWAFLGGDRIDQPSSRDHLDRSVRWFPSEMEKFAPLIHEKEQEIEKLARPSLQQRP
ncbi:MAG: GDSL-type esterase/lipase family protein [Verrucomicrobiales bacterium]